MKTSSSRRVASANSEPGVRVARLGVGLVAACAVLASSLGAAPAWGQGQELTEEQRAIAKQALEAFKAGRYPETIALYERSLAIKPLNVTYITLGYAYFNAGRCEDAARAYGLAADAPQVVKPSPELLRETLEAYQAELPTRCAQLTLECRAPGLRVELDARPEVICGGQSFWLSPGAHTIVVKGADGRTREQALSLQTTERIVLPMEAPEPAVVTVEPSVVPRVVTPPTQPPPAPEPSPLRAWAWGVGGTGLAALLSVGVWEVAVFQPGLDALEEASDARDAARYQQRLDALEQQQLWGRVIGGAGVLLVVGGGILYGLSSPDEEAAPPVSSLRPAVQLWSDGAGVGCSWGW